MYSSKKKLGFTLVEMIIVIAIVSTLFLAIQNGFQPSNTNKIQAQSCLQNSYGQIQSRLYAGLTQRSIPTNPPNFPETYAIQLDPSEQHIALGFSGEVFTTIDLNQANNIGCTNNRYQVTMTGSTTDITIQNKTMTAASFTGSTNFLLCQAGECEPLGSIYYDTRSQQIRLYICPQGIDDFCL